MPAPQSSRQAILILRCALPRPILNKELNFITAVVLTFGLLAQN
jgi:hypothetical protein